jgi:DNA-binding response OmpR family regulator
MREQAHGLVLLDRLLPRLDGIDVLRIARKEGVMTPVLMVTGLGSSENMIEGLDYGADDYIVKPFIMEELLARIRAMGRRPRAFRAQEAIRYGDMVFDPMKKLLISGAKKTTLTKRECALMEVFMKNIGSALPRETLLTHVWGAQAIVEEGILDSYISFLRRRLKSVDSPLGVNTIRGVGFVMEERAAAD